MAAAAPPPSSREFTFVNLEVIDMILVSGVAAHALLLMALSSPRRRSAHPALRHILWALSAVYLPFMFYVLKTLTTNLPKLRRYNQTWMVIAVVLIQFLKAKADVAALAAAAVASPAPADDGSLRFLPSTDSVAYSFWVAGLVMYYIAFKSDNADPTGLVWLLSTMVLLIIPLWVLGACRMLLRFVAFRRAASSFAFGRNVQLMDGYLRHLQADVDERKLPDADVPHRLIVTGERDEDVEESPLGYGIKAAASSAPPQADGLITLELVMRDGQLAPRHKDLCLSFALFKCLRRRLAGYYKLPEDGSRWAFRFVRDGLLGQPDDYERIFRVISDELAFASDFYYSHLPLASLVHPWLAAIYFLLSSLIVSFVCLLLLPIVYAMDRDWAAKHHNVFMPLPLILAVVIVILEVLEMAAGVRSNWTTIKMIGHLIRSRRNRSSCRRKILSWLLTRSKPGLGHGHWKDEVGQVDLFNRPVTKLVPLAAAAKAAILGALRDSDGRQLGYGTAAVQRRGQAFRRDVAWACYGGELTTDTDAILVWCIATTFFEAKFSSRQFSSSSAAPPPTDDNKLVATCLSRYCMYLLVEAPDLLPDNSAWTKRHYQEVKEKIEAGLQKWCGQKNTIGAKDLAGFLDSEPSHHEVLLKGSRLGKRLVEEADQRWRSEEGEAGAGDGDEGAVWEILAAFWADMLLYLAPSDNVKGHIEVLKRGGELITLLWALLLHAGITSRPARPARPDDHV